MPTNRNNPQGGGPDPAILQFLFSRQDARRKAERQALLDQASSVEAAREAARKDAKEQRDIEAHRATMRKNNIETLLKTQGEMAKGVGEAQQNVGAQKFQGSDLSIGSVPTNTVGGGGAPLLSDPGSNAENAAFAQILSQNDPQGVDSFLDARSTLDTRLDTGAAIQSSVTGAPLNSSRSSLLGAADSARTEERRVDDTELRRVKAAEKRAASTAQAVATSNHKRTIQRAEIAHAQSVGRPTEVILERDRTMLELQRKIETETDPEKLELFAKQFDSLAAEAQAARLRNVGDGYFRQLERVSGELAQYNTQYETTSILEEILAIAEFDTSAIGTEAVINQVMTNLPDIIERVTGKPFEDFYAQTIQATLDNPNTTDEIKQKILDTYEDPEILDRISRGRLAEVETVWTLNYMFNRSGRVNQKMLQNIQDVAGFIGFFIGPKLAKANLRATIGRNRAGLKTRREEMFRRDNTLRFDSKTGEWVPNTPINATMDAKFASPRTDRQSQQAPTPRVDNKLTPERLDRLLAPEAPNRGQ